MIDAHVHVALGRKKESGQQWVRKVLLSYGQNGVTGLRDGGDGFGLSELARQLAPQLGLVYRSPIFAIYKKGRYAAFVGRDFADLAELKALMKRLFEKKPDFVKLILTGLVDFETGEVKPGFDRGEADYAVQFAHDKGFRVMAHCNGAANIESALRAGVDTIEHGYLIGDEQLCQMAQTGVIWTPTLVPLYNYAKSPVATACQRENIARLLADHGKSVARAYDLGVRLAVGSDGGSLFVEHGTCTDQEVECLVRTGLLRKQVLKFAEENGRLALGIE